MARGVRNSGSEGPGGWLPLPRFWGFSRVFTRVGMGSLVRVRASQVGEAGVGMGRTPRVPGRVPPQIPPRVYHSPCHCPPANDYDDEMTVSERPRGRPQRTDALRAQAPESRTSTRRNPTCLPPLTTLTLRPAAGVTLCAAHEPVVYERGMSDRR
jgi:hypothetical protein